MENLNKNKLKAQQWLIWTALLLSLATLALVLMIQPSKVPLESNPLPLPIASTIALVLSVLSLAIPKLLRKSNPSGDVIAMLIGLALAESVAIIGFVHAFSSGEGLQAFWPFLTGAAALYVLHRPK